MGRTGALEYNRPGLKVWLSHLLSVFYYLLLFATFSSVSPHHLKTMPDWLLSIIIFIISIVKIWREWCWSKCMDSRTNKALGDFGRIPVLFVMVQHASLSTSSGDSLEQIKKSEIWNYKKVWVFNILIIIVKLLSKRVALIYLYSYC